MQTIRLIIDEKANTAAKNMAIDTALQHFCTTPTLRLYTWNPAAISIGRFQSLQDEVNEDACKKNKVDIIRRVTGGGAVFHENEITYSFCIPEKNNYFSTDLHESYQFICQAVIIGLNKFNLDVKYIPINDLIVNNKKISGCAQTRKKGILLQHGTILMKVNVDKMFQLLKVPNEKIRDKLITDVKARVTSIENEIKNIVSKEQVIKNIITGFEQQLKVKTIQSDMTAEEIKFAEQIEKDVFLSKNWNYER